MYNKSGFSVITLIFWVIGFIIIWALFVAKLLNDWGQAAIANNSLTGIEAFFYANLNFVIGIVFLIAILAIGLWGTGE